MEKVNITDKEPTIGQAICGFDHLGVGHFGSYEGKGQMSIGREKEIIEIIEWEPQNGPFAD